MKHHQFSQLTIFFLSLFLFSCANKKEDEKTNKVEIAFSIDTLRIPIDTLSEPFLGIFSAYSDGNSNLLYNCAGSQLQIIDLDSGKVLKTLQLQFGGSDGISEVYSMAVKSKNEVFLQTAKDIVLIDEEGKVKKRWKINQNDENLLQNNDGFPMQVFENKALLMQHFRGESEKMKNTSFARLIDFNTEERKDLPILFPKELQENYKAFEYFAFAQATFSEGKLYYNFPYSSDIYCYDFSTQKIVSQNVASVFGNKIAASYKNGQAFEKYMAENVHYLRPLVDEKNALIYRLYWGKPKAENVNLFLEKPFYLSILDKNLNLIKEIEVFHHNYAPNRFFIAQKGLYMCVMHPKSNMEEDFLTLHLYKFQKKENFE